MKVIHKMSILSNNSRDYKKREVHLMDHTVYLRMKKKLHVKSGTSLKLSTIADIFINTPLDKDIGELIIYDISDDKNRENHVVVIDQFFLRKCILTEFPKINVHFFGVSETIVQISHRQNIPSILLAVIVWFILFIGTAMTIMNFHYDVGMQETQQKIHYMLTGKVAESPLWIQIPYSLGLGVGMLLFFNHWFKKRFNNEPSPLEIEISKYQDALDDYIKKHEKHVD